MKKAKFIGLYNHHEEKELDRQLTEQAINFSSALVEHFISTKRQKEEWDILSLLKAPVTESTRVSHTGSGDRNLTDDQIFRQNQITQT